MTDVFVCARDSRDFQQWVYSEVPKYHGKVNHLTHDRVDVVYGSEVVTYRNLGRPAAIRGWTGGKIVFTPQFFDARLDQLSLAELRDLVMAVNIR